MTTSTKAPEPKPEPKSEPEKRRVFAGVPGVVYSLEDGRYPGEWRPALVVKIWEEDMCNLQVFLDGSNDGIVQPSNNDGMVWRTSVKFGTERGCWNWADNV